MNNIKVDKGFYTVFELKRRFDNNDKRVILDSDFQRGDVWGLERKAELIESVLMGLPLPIFYFNQDKYGRLIVVDGRQRLTALFEYMDNKFALKNLKILPNVNGKHFSELPPILASRIEDYQVQAHVIMPPTPDRIKFDIFDRVNRGGMQLNKQEIRNALYQGEATRFLNRVVKSREFGLATGDAFADETRMKDKYLITRFVAFYLYREGRILDEKGQPYVYKNDLDELLGKGMDVMNNMSPEEIAKLENMVLETLDKSYYYMGKDAFRIRREMRRSPINMNVFETVMFYLLQISGKDEEQREFVKGMIVNFMEEKEFTENIGNHRDNAVPLHWRLEQAVRLGKGINA